MESALAWIGEIAEWVGKLIPRPVLLPATMGAVKYVHGTRIEVCGPGLHWYWPIVTAFDDYPIVEQTVDLRTQTVTTSDDKTVAIGGLLIYTVTDLAKLLPAMQNPDKQIAELALTSIHDVCCRMSWGELKDGQQRRTLHTELKNRTQRALSPYGVDVVRVTLTDKAPCRVLKVMQSVSND